MPAPILATKLYIPPPRQKIVSRPRLIEHLNEGLSSGCMPGVTLISAAAGFGKTTLTSEWITTFAPGSSTPASTHPVERKGDVKVAWLSLDEGDSDLTRFLIYLVAALQTIERTLGEGVLASLQSSQPHPTEALLTLLLNEIAASPERFILVLDDYHLINSKSVDQAMAFFVEHLPPQIHLVIASREDPSLPLARLRVRRQLTELRAADLRFTPTETADFLNQVMGLNLSAENIAALETRTEGWIAGLQLAALSMQGQKDTASFIQSFTGSHHFVLDYLLQEVLHQQPENIQNFLLCTSILNRLCGPLCEAVLETSNNSSHILENLERANLFIIPLDNERRWYRYHHLFGDLLRQRLGQTLPPSAPSRWTDVDGGIASLHMRASQWYETNSDLAEAFPHALAARAFERAARLAEAAWQGMDESFQTAAWLGWVKKLPETVIRTRPVLCVQIGWAFSDAGDPEASERHLQYAERSLDGTPDQAEFRPLPGSIALSRAYNAQMQGNLADTVKYAELATQLIPENDIYRRAQAAVTLEFTHWATGNLDASLRAMNNWIDSMQKIGNTIFVVASAFAVADIQVVLGRLDEAEKTLWQAIQLAKAHSKEAEQVTAHHYLELALLAHERGNDESSAQYLQKAAEWGQQTTLVDWPYRWRLAQARMRESAGEWDAALELLDEAKRVYVKNPVPILQPVEALKTRAYLKQGRLDKAQAWARERGLAVTDEVSYLNEFELLTLVRVRLAEGTFIGVSSLLERLLALAETQKRIGSVLEILLVQAHTHQTQGNLPLALAALEQALTLAEPEGYLRIFVDEGEAMRLMLADFRLLIEKQSNHRLLGYVDNLLAGFVQPTANTAQSKIQNKKSEIIEPLSERELEILLLVAQGLSNAEISQRLFLALSTVKGHNLRIFGKLQAQNRTDAVARARELGLI